MTELGELQAAQCKIRDWRTDARVMVADLWPDVALEPWQNDALEAISRPGKKRIVASACAGVGKTAWLSWTAWHRLICYGTATDHPKGVAVSMDGSNLATNLVPEIAKWGRSAAGGLIDEAFNIGAERIRAKDHPETWLLDFRAWPRKADPAAQGDTLQGLHSGFPFVLMDECASIPVPVGRRAENIEAAPGTTDSLIAGTGNPTTQEGVLYWAAVVESEAAGWAVFWITADPEDPRRCSRVDRGWAQAQIDKAPMGREDPMIQAFILGRFPKGGLHQLLTREDVEEALKRAPKPHEYEGMPMVLGVDVARGGLDSSVIYRRQHKMVWPPIRRRGIDGILGASLVAQEWTRHECDAAMVDATGGFGASWIDQLRVMGFAPIGVQFAGSARDPKRYFNKRTEMWFEMATAIKAGCALPPDAGKELLRELPAPLYGFKGDRLLLEPKESVSARIGGSPDDGDSLALTWGEIIAPKMLPHQAAIAMARQRSMSRFDDHGYSDGDLPGGGGGVPHLDVPPWGPLRL